MAKHKLPVTQEEVLQLEKYVYELHRYTQTAEVMKDMDTDKVHKLLIEVQYMQMALNIYSKLFPKFDCSIFMINDHFNIESFTNCFNRGNV